MKFSKELRLMPSPWPQLGVDSIGKIGKMASASLKVRRRWQKSTWPSLSWRSTACWYQGEGSWLWSTTQNADTWSRIDNEKGMALQMWIDIVEKRQLTKFGGKSKTLIDWITRKKSVLRGNTKSFVVCLWGGSISVLPTTHDIPEGRRLYPTCTSPQYGDFM